MLSEGATEASYADKKECGILCTRCSQTLQESPSFTLSFVIKFFAILNQKYQNHHRV